MGYNNSSVENINVYMLVGNTQIWLHRYLRPTISWWI